ncbi:hypothetical protein FIBSPDRAFT_1052773 [Athelia psychrophila]|uniref:Uncharacterized protein n=1 Tax=Athelia psychrophila TaxID=1759441 RepID=A0A165WPM8_9AGAM|nr:hypothetical protein FIBSPDRAFT_1052773 [Fibularhizoctonia sp. CBS 109695]
MAVTRVDDASPLIHYTGSWFGDISPNNTQEYNHTQHLTRVIGSSASFSFNGTQVTVLGSYAGSPRPTSEYSIDNGPPTSFTGLVNATVELYDQVFYQSPPLVDGEHTLTLKLVAGDWFWFDELRFLPSSASSKPKAPIGAIVGGVLAGLIAVVALVFLWLFWRKRRRERHMYSPALQAETANFHEAEIVPFSMYAADPQPPHDASLSKRQPGLGLPAVPSSSSSSSQMLGISTDHGSVYSSPSQPSQSKHSLATQIEAAHVVVRHANDGGGSHCRRARRSVANDPGAASPVLVLQSYCTIACSTL